MLLDQTAGVHHSWLQRLSLREGEQLGGKFRTAGNTREGALDPHLGPGVAGDILAQQLQVSADDLQQVVEVVSDAASQLPDRLPASVNGSGVACAAWSAASASRRSVMSRVTLAKPMSLPSSSRMASITTCAQKRRAVLSDPVDLHAPNDRFGLRSPDPIRGRLGGTVSFRIEVGEMAADDLFGA